jgi:hypothetical protein
VGTSPPANPGDAWPRRAVPLSAVGALIGVVLVLVGLAQAGDRSVPTKTFTVAMAAAMAVLWSAILLWFVGRWFSGRLTSSTRSATLVVCVILAVALFLMARSSEAGPPGVAGIGGALVGVMVANILSVRRARSR